MRTDTPAAPETPEAGPPTRYFTNGDCHQAVHNLTDPAPILAAGFEEIDEDAYRALLAGLPEDDGATL